MIQSVQRASDILNYIAHHGNKVKLSDISTALGINKSTIHGLTQSLVCCGMLSQNPETSLYSLGLRVYEFGKIYERDFSLTEIARPFMQELADRFQETVHLAIESDYEVLYIDRIQTNHSIRVASNVGGIDPLYATSAGKVILAYKDSDYVNYYLKHFELRPLTPNTITNGKKLTDQLDSIRHHGYAVDNEEIELGLRCVSSPILNAGGTLLGTISVSGPTIRITDDIFQSMCTETSEICSRISQKLGFVPGNSSTVK